MLFRQINFNNYDHKSKFNLFNIICLGTYRKSYVTRLIRQCNTTSVISNHKFLTLDDLKILKTLCKLKKKKGKVINFSKMLQNVTLLKMSYKLVVLKLHSKNYFKLTNVITSTQNKWFKNLSFKLKTGNFTYLKIENQKNLNFSNFKLLKLSKLRNNIVNQALELILEIFYEPFFISTSHGFRPFKGCHSALKQIKLFWNDVSWVTSYKFKIKQTINFTKLIKLMSSRINDKFLFTLLKNFLKANTFNFNLKDIKVLTPLLINIYLHHLDLELEKLKKNYNFFFKKLFYFNFNVITLRKTRFRTLNIVKYGRILTHKTLYGQYKTKLKKLKIQNSKFKPFKIRYIRYLNFFMTGIDSNRKENYHKLNKFILTFCNSNLKLLLAYKNAIKINSNIVINFLNFEIRFLQFDKFSSNSKKSLEKYSNKKKSIALKKVTFKILKQKKLLLSTFSKLFFNLKKKQSKKKNNYFKVLTLNKYKHLSKKKNLIIFKAPLFLLKNNLIRNKILSITNKTKSLIWLTHYSNYLIVKWFRIKSKFLLNVYCCCHNLNKIKIFVDRILRYCAIKTLAIKNKLTISKTIKTWSKNMIIKDKTNRLILIKYLTKLEIQKQKKKFLIDLNFLKFNNQN